MNPINYAKGLIDAYERAKVADSDLASRLRDELESMADEIRSAVSELRGLVDPATMELEDGTRVPTSVAADIQATGRRLEEILGSGHAKRTTRANAAKDKAAPPAAS